MSYILEALRKADAERERGSVPDLQSQLLPGSPVDDEPEPLQRASWRWPALAVGVVALGLLAWWFYGTAPDPADSPPVAAAAPSPAVAALPPAAPPSAVAPAEPAPEPAPKPAPPPERSRAARAKSDAATPAKAPVSKPVKNTAKAAAPAAPPARVPRLNELPEDLRRMVPALAIGGWVYSPQADKRMVIVNGQVFQEGAMLAAELKLEQVRPKAAVFSIRGERFEVPL